MQKQGYRENLLGVGQPIREPQGPHGNSSLKEMCVSPFFILHGKVHGLYGLTSAVSRRRHVPFFHWPFDLDSASCTFRHVKVVS